MKRAEKIKQLNTEIDWKWFDVDLLENTIANCDITPKGKIVIEKRITHLKNDIKKKLCKIARLDGVRSSAGSIFNKCLKIAENTSKK